jgi:hypothetical protein
MIELDVAYKVDFRSMCELLLSILTRRRIFKTVSGVQNRWTWGGLSAYLARAYFLRLG